MREIGRTYAPLELADDDLMPGLPGTDELFESEPIPAQAWKAFETSPLCELFHTIEHGGLIGSY